ncbi:MAG TPA: S9 family peptidase [Thermomicrobiales bacterium]|nr:S9 family peptidase [Thermomicrobiales bacterium]
MTVTPETTRLTTDDLLDLRQVSDANLRRQGDLVAYVVADNTSAARVRKAASRIWAVAASGGEPRPLTADGTRAYSPRWSPDGHALAFLGSRDAEGPGQLFLLDDSLGEARRLTDAPGGVSTYAWTPDGQSLIAAMPDPAPEDEEAEHEAGRDWLVYEDAPRLTRLWRVDVATGERTAIEHGDLHVWELTVSPEGTAVATIVSDAPHNWSWYDGRLARIDLASGAVTTLLAGERQVTLPAWSSDGQRVALIVSTFSDQGMTGGDIVVAGIDGAQRKVTEGHPRSYLIAHWEDDERLLCVAIDDGELSIGRLGLDGHYHELWRDQRGIARWDGTILSVADHPEAPSVAAVLSAPDAPSDVYVARVHDDSLSWRRLTETNPEIAERELVRPEVVRWQSFDETWIQGLLVRPAGAHPPHPTVVLIHGGPTSVWGFDFPGTRSMGWVQLLVAAGYAVFLPNPRGSIGWGRAFAEANAGDMGGGDLTDILTGVEMLVEQGIADPERLGVGGWSYGGYLTAWAITQTNRFRAAVAGASITNWISFHGGSTIQAFDQLFYQDDPFGWDGRYGQFSPMAHVRNARTPTLFLHGEKDPICPVGQAYEMWRALRECGVETELVVYPREGHGPLEREHLRDVLERGVHWLTERV